MPLGLFPSLFALQLSVVLFELAIEWALGAPSSGLVVSSCLVGALIFGWWSETRIPGALSDDKLLRKLAVAGLAVQALVVLVFTVGRVRTPVPSDGPLTDYLLFYGAIGSALGYLATWLGLRWSTRAPTQP